MDSLLIQSWTFFALSVSFVFARLIFRRIMLKRFKDLQMDDWIMVFLLLPLTASVVLTIPAGDAYSEKQSIYRYVVEELQIVMTWLVKACLLVLYWRIFPVAFSILRRRYLQIVSMICAISFIITQISLFSWCHPVHLAESQCSSNYDYTIVSMTFSTLTTVLVLILPIPFIPTPRRFLLSILVITGISILALNTLARFYILTAPASRTYLFYYTYEITLLIVFANLPFLTSLVVTTAPARIREFSRNFSLSREAVNLPLSPWSLSRRTSTQAFASPSIRSSRLGSAGTVIGEGTEKKEWTIGSPVMRPESARTSVGTVERSHSERILFLTSQC